MHTTGQGRGGGKKKNKKCLQIAEQMSKDFRGCRDDSIELSQRFRLR